MTIAKQETIVKGVNDDRFVKTVTYEEKDRRPYDISLSGNMVVINKRNRASEFTQFGQSGRTRERITKFSESSGRRMRKYLRECTVEYRNMVTLTYPHNFETDGRKSKEHLRRFVQELKRYCVRERIYRPLEWSVFWFMEFQSRGAIHYHLFTTFEVPYKKVSSLWFNICGTDDVRHLHAGTRCERLRAGRAGTISYAAKYATKQTQKEVPDCIKNCGRFWGVSGARWVVSADTRVTPEATEHKSVYRSVKAIREEIVRGFAEGRITKYETNSPDSFVYFINDDALRLRIRDRIMILNSKMLTFGFCNRPSLMYSPEILYDELLDKNGYQVL